MLNSSYKHAFRNLLWFIISVFGLLCTSCKSVSVSRQITHSLESSFYKSQFTGLLVYNPKSGDTLVSFNADRYFTPASNVKIFTLYTALQYLPERIPAFQYATDQDTLWMRSVGDPTFLHPYFKDSTALKMAENYASVRLITGNLKDEKYGPGWAWEDYDSNFSPERSSFPMYGNVVQVFRVADDLYITPKVFGDAVSFNSGNLRRDYHSNQFYYPQNRQMSIETPMVMDSLTLQSLWNDLLPNKVQVLPSSLIDFNQTAYSIASDDVYRRMMLESDNFLAEQLLVLSASQMGDPIDTEKLRKTLLETYLKELKSPPRWVDGSGLSRYNLFTPRSFVSVLHKLYTTVPADRLYEFFPAGGVSGTLKHWFLEDDKPYLFAKTGTVGNNFALSGYLLTDSGETLIFSFMNNHYMKPSAEVKAQMQLVLERLKTSY